MTGESDKPGDRGIATVLKIMAVVLMIGIAFVGGYYIGYRQADNSPGVHDVEEMRAIDSVQGDGEINITVHFDNGTSITYDDPKKGECIAYQHGLLNYTPEGCCEVFNASS